MDKVEEEHRVKLEQLGTIQNEQRYLSYMITVQVSPAIRGVMFLRNLEFAKTLYVDLNYAKTVFPPYLFTVFLVLWFANSQNFE